MNSISWGVASTLCILLLGHSAAQSTPLIPENQVPVAPPSSVVYVSDFEIDATGIQQNVDRRPALASRAPIGGRLPVSKTVGPKDKQTIARELVDVMATALVQSLKESGADARRIGSLKDFPTNGWLVRGIFLQVDEGQRARRAVIGFGSGKTDLQVQATCERLSKGQPQPFYRIEASADSGKAPGAVILLNPVMAAARFVRSEGDLQRNCQETAGKLAHNIIAILSTSPPETLGKNPKRN